MKWNLFALVVLSIFTCISCSEKVNETSTASLPLEPPPFETVSLDQIPVYNFDELEPLLNLKNDTTYIINFWATWCQPCIEELPYFEELNDYTFGKKMKVILVSLDFKKQLETKLVPYINEHKVRSEVVVLSDPASNTWIPKIDSNWSGAIPITILYNQENRLFLEMVFEDYTQIKNIVEKFNREISES